ncbi:WD repeat-containing protein 5 [Drosophila simulans]|uniref:GD11312 n=2 Tax=Drosophila simulans TaxID=7240 RepID=B4QBD8_DROSI|nr:WD repeat-containing protein 5 [Drosophila simulans]EDX07562.1 GD11312 [Drosophila simulans]KMY94673.1 uncharacterized protein Dsimw501_GD11312, isoform A [Drosophila simulans]
MELIETASTPGDSETETAIPEAAFDSFKMPILPSQFLQSSVSPGYSIKHSLLGHSGSVTGLKFSSCGENLVSSSADMLLMLWDLSATRCIQSLAGHENGVNDVAWSADGLIASCSDDKTVRLWDSRSKLCVKVLKGHCGYTFSCCFNPQSNLLASTSFDETVRLWDVRTGKTLEIVRAHQDPITSVDFHREGNIFVTSSFDGLVRLWDTSTGHVMKTLVDVDNIPVGHVKFSPNGRYILSSTLNNTLRLWNYNKSKCLRIYRGHTNQLYCSNSNFSITGGIWIVSGSEDNTLCIWNLQTRELVQKISTEGDQVLCTHCHPTENVIASGALQNSYAIKIWKSSDNYNNQPNPTH